MNKWSNLFLFFVISVALPFNIDGIKTATACGNFLDANIQNIQIPPPNDPKIPGTWGIASFNNGNKDCTLDCSCIFDVKLKTWNASAKNCVFKFQCQACKSTDQACEIRFNDPPTASRYSKTFYRDEQHKPTIIRCKQNPPDGNLCEAIEKLPSYRSVEPVSN